MAKNAQYILKEYLEALWLSYGIELKPGKYAAPEGTSDDSFAVYSVVSNRNYFQPYIHEDNMQVRVYHTLYDSISDIVNLAVDALNHENAQVDLDTKSTRQLFADFKAEGFNLLETSCRASGLDQNEFIEGSEYYFATLDIMCSYVNVGA